MRHCKLLVNKDDNVERGLWKGKRNFLLTFGFLRTFSKVEDGFWGKCREGMIRGLTVTAVNQCWVDSDSKELWIDYFQQLPGKWIVSWLRIGSFQKNRDSRFPLFLIDSALPLTRSSRRPYLREVTNTYLAPLLCPRPSLPSLFSHANLLRFRLTIRRRHDDFSLPPNEDFYTRHWYTSHRILRLQSDQGRKPQYPISLQS